MSRNQLTAALDVLQPLGPRALTWHLDASYRDGFTTNVNDLACNLSQGQIVEDARRANYRVLRGFALINASVSLQTSGALRLRQFINNLTDQASLTARTIRYNAADHSNFVYLSRPRTAGLAVIYSFQ